MSEGGQLPSRCLFGAPGKVAFGPRQSVIRVDGLTIEPLQ